MGKNVHLANIYIKIYNRQTLTIDDLDFLAKYDPECFEKTCRNVVYKVPQTKEIFKPLPPAKETGCIKQPLMGERVEDILARLKKMELKELPVQYVNSGEVKELLGNLYMELMFPHNDKEQYFDMMPPPVKSGFNKKV